MLGLLASASRGVRAFKQRSGQQTVPATGSGRRRRPAHSDALFRDGRTFSGFFFDVCETANSTSLRTKGIRSMRILLGGLLLVVGGLFAAPMAQAQSCPGNLIAVKAIKKADGTRVGELQLYYNPATGNNCARTVHGGPWWGVSKYTDVFLLTCTRTRFINNGGHCYQGSLAEKYWAGNVSYYTSPVSLYGVGRCVSVNGGMTWTRDGQLRSAVAFIDGYCR